MIIRKLFKFEGAHIVRNCTSGRCAKSVHGHSYVVEILLEGGLDKGQMVYDFGLLKTTVKTLIDSFDHAITLWDRDDSEYLADQKKHSERWISVPFSPSAEMYSLFFYTMVHAILAKTRMMNGENGVKVNSVIVHETATGYAQSFYEDAFEPVNCVMRKPVLDLTQVVFSEAIKEDWPTTQLWNQINDNTFTFQNPPPFQQVSTD